MWLRWLTHLGLVDASGTLVADAKELFVARYEGATFGGKQWLVNSFSVVGRPIAGTRTTLATLARR
jgi:hypothetical protein